MKHQQWAVTPRRQYLNRAAKRHQKVQKLYSQGLTKPAIANELTMGLETVHHALQQDKHNSS